MTLQIFLRPVDVCLFPTTFIQGGYVFPAPRYIYVQFEGGVRYTLDDFFSNSSTSYYNSDPAITIYGSNLTVDSNGYAQGTVTEIVFSSLNRGTIAQLDGLSLPAQDIMQFLEARLARDVTSGNRFQDFIGGLIDGVDEILLGDGSDALELGGFFGSPGRVDLGGGNDTLTGTAADDSVIGGDGNDRIDGRGGNDTLFGSTGDDALIGDTGHDSLNGWYGDDYLNGWYGNDTLHAVYGSDTLDGGEGNDLYSADGRSADTVQIRDSGGFDTLVMYNFPGTDMQGFVNTGTEVIRITAYEHRTVIPIVDGAPVIEMLRWLDVDEDGNDGDSYDLALVIDQAAFTRLDSTFAGTDGDDTIVAPSGDPAGVTARNGEIFGNGGNDDITLSETYLFIALAGDGDDTIRAGGTQAGWGFGGFGNDLLLGAEGDDTLQGNEGDDTLRGDAGNDNLLGGSGFDLMDGGDGNDTLYGAADRVTTASKAAPEQTSFGARLATTP
jgi:Ca2+-binding RTX toxin-like protein